MTHNNVQTPLMDEVIKVFDALGHEITYDQAVAALPEAHRSRLKEDYFKKLKYRARAGRLATGSFSKAKPHISNVTAKQKIDKPKDKPDAKKIKPEELFDKQDSDPKAGLLGAGGVDLPSLKDILGDGPMIFGVGAAGRAIQAEVGLDKVKITSSITFDMSDDNAKKVFQPTATLAAVTSAKNLIDQMGGDKENAIKLLQMM